MFRDELIDLALVIMVMGIVITVGLGLTVRTEKKARLDSSVTLEDKNTRTQKGQGIDAHGDLDGGLTKEGIRYLFQIQDPIILESEKATILKADGTMEDIQINYTEQSDFIGVDMKLRDLLSDGVRYEIRFTGGTYLISPITN